MSTRVLILSDLHMEVPGAEVFAPRPEGADLIVLAGDIHEGVKGLEWAARMAALWEIPLVYVAGNHEYWRQRMDLLPGRLREMAARYRLSGLPVYFLEQDTAIIETAAQPVRVLGATLWSDFTLHGEDGRRNAMDAARSHMPDYRMIRTGRMPWQRLKPAQTLEICECTIRWMWDVVVHPFAGPTVIVTHTGPSFKSIDASFSSHLLSPVFASDFEEVIRFGHVALWAHGHVHHSVDYPVFASRVIANPRGYWPNRLNPDFDPGLIVEV
jgi:predicted phosphodiesterase